MTSPAPSSFWQRIGPALTLVFAAPMAAEVLPGATRLSSLFVLPIEMCVWGGGALLIRGAVRRWHLGWRNLLFLAVALAIAEECLIQQTSLAPLVIQLKGEVYARAYGVNYVYFLWALVYESIFVVFVPVYLVELIFPGRRDGVWVSKAGFIAASLLFLLGGFLAWFSWTRIARPKVFHLPAYNPPFIAVLIAGSAICGLVFLALGPFRNTLARASRPLRPPPLWLAGILGALWAALWFGLVLLAFGIAPSISPSISVVAGLALVVAMVQLVPRWTADRGWDRRHVFAVVFGTMFGAMMAGFIGFQGAARADLYFKIIVNFTAVVLLITLGFEVSRESAR